MKVRIRKPKSYFGPYQLAQVLFFWTAKTSEFGTKEYPSWVHSLGEVFAYGSIEEKQFDDITHLLKVVNERKKTQLHKMLNWIHKKRKRRITVQIDDWDVFDLDHTLAHIIMPALRKFREYNVSFPSHLDVSDLPESLRNSEGIDQWNYILDEMLFAFENTLDVSYKGVDLHQHKEILDRMNRGFLLFGKYYKDLWI